MQLVFFFPPAGDLIYIRKHVLGSILKKNQKKKNPRQIKVYESFRLKIEISGSSLKRTKKTHHYFPVSERTMHVSSVAVFSSY